MTSRGGAEGALMDSASRFFSLEFSDSVDHGPEFEGEVLDAWA
jgi:hypothetical protein